jgi:hypothetical protein
MSLLVKKVEKGKWLQNDIVRGEDISADAITNCMKTTENTLSMWRINEEVQIDEAVLAIVSAQDHLDAIDVVWVKLNQLEEYEISMRDAPGRTPIADLVDSHVNIVNLTYRSLGKVAYCIVECFSDNNVRRYTRATLKRLLQKAIESGRLEVKRIAPSLAEKLS